MTLNLLRTNVRRTRKDTPLHRLLAHGAEPLSDAELLAVLLKRDDPQALQELLDSYGSLKQLMSEQRAALEHHALLGPEKSAQLFAAVEFGRRLREHRDMRSRLFSPEDIYSYLAPKLDGLTHEVFHVLCFNSHNVLLRDERVAIGSIDQVTVDPRDVFGVALATRAVAIVLAHNHPSGDSTPSSLDVTLTQHLLQGADLLRIRILDHLIVGHRRFYSMSASGQLQREPS